MINTYVPYSNPYIGTSSYFTSYGDIGTGFLSSKSSIGIIGPSNNNQVNSVHTEYTSTKL